MLIRKSTAARREAYLRDEIAELHRALDEIRSEVQDLTEQRDAAHLARAAAREAYDVLTARHADLEQQVADLRQRDNDAEEPAEPPTAEAAVSEAARGNAQSLVLHLPDCGVCRDSLHYLDQHTLRAAAHAARNGGHTRTLQLILTEADRRATQTPEETSR